MPDTVGVRANVTFPEVICGNESVSLIHEVTFKITLPPSWDTYSEAEKDAFIQARVNAWVLNAVDGPHYEILE